MIYIWKQCPGDRGRGSPQSVSPCGAQDKVTTTAKEVAKWLRDMGDTITVSFNLNSWHNTRRGPYTSTWSGEVQCTTQEETDFCNFDGRTFTGQGGTVTHHFFACNGCSEDCGGYLCPDGDEGTWEVDVSATLNSWVFDPSVPSPSETDGPNYTSQIHWNNPIVCLTPKNCSGICELAAYTFCTDACLPGAVHLYGNWFTSSANITQGTWSFNPSAFTFRANWNFQNPESQGCPCWNVATGNEEKPCKCYDGEHDIRSRGSINIVIAQGGANPLRCPI